MDFFSGFLLVDLHFATLPIMEKNPLAAFLSVRAPKLIPTFTRLEDSLPEPLNEMILRIKKKLNNINIARIANAVQSHS